LNGEQTDVSTTNPVFVIRELTTSEVRPPHDIAARYGWWRDKRVAVGSHIPALLNPAFAFIAVFGQCGPNSNLPTSLQFMHPNGDFNHGSFGNSE
jgi:hypothetical protein